MSIEILGRGRREGGLRRGVGREEVVNQMTQMEARRRERRGGERGMSHQMMIMSVSGGIGRVGRRRGGGEATDILMILILMHLMILAESELARAEGPPHHLILMQVAQMIHGLVGARSDLRRRAGNAVMTRIIRVYFGKVLNLVLFWVSFTIFAICYEMVV